MATQKTYRIGSSIKTLNNKGIEKFYTVEMVAGDIGLFVGCSKKFKRELKEDEQGKYFIFNDVRYNKAKES